REEACLLERTAQRRLIIGERARNAVTNGTRLTGKTTTRHRAGYVVLVFTGRNDERLVQDHAQIRAREIALQLTAIDADAARARLYPHAGNGVLTTAGRIGAAELVELRLGGGRVRVRRACAFHRALQVFERGCFGHDYAILTFLRFWAAKSIFSGCCASCGWSAPLEMGR